MWLERLLNRSPVWARTSNEYRGSRQEQTTARHIYDAVDSERISATSWAWSAGVKSIAHTWQQWQLYGCVLLPQQKQLLASLLLQLQRNVVSRSIIVKTDRLSALRQKHLQNAVTQTRLSKWNTGHLLDAFSLTVRFWFRRFTDEQLVVTDRRSQLKINNST